VFGQNQDENAYIPLSTMVNQLSGRNRNFGVSLNFISVEAKDAESVNAAAFQITNLLRQRHRILREDDFAVRSQKDALTIVGTITGGLTLMLAAIGGVSLLVGGIGIMNIMLVSVTERTREIGLRMAVGARGRDILKQFLVEALVLSMIGGAIGILLGVGASMLIAQLANWNTDITPQAIALAVGFAGAIGVFFGFYPARKASRLLPIEALRYE
jgi:putative ABC transport system permease protein